MVFPARLFGIRHKNDFFERMTWDEIAEWSANRQEGLYPMVAQPEPEYEWIVRLGPSRWGLSRSPTAE